jgi:small subunit ribosomal protein S14
MAKKSTVEKNERRKQMAVKATDAEKRAAQVALQKLPRNSALQRVRNRCQMSGRSRGYVRTFGLSRIAFREMALQGLIPGVRKASW